MRSRPATLHDHHTATALLMLLAAVLPMALGGCAANKTRADPAEGAVIETGPRFEVLAANVADPSAAAPLLAAETSLRAPAWADLRAWDRDDDRVLRVLRQTDPASGAIVVRRTLFKAPPTSLGDAGEPDSEDRFRASRVGGEDVPEGAVALLESYDPQERVWAVFTPPLVAVPASIRPGETRPQDLSLVAQPEADRTKTRSKGKVRNEVRCVGVDRVRTPLGEFTAHHLVSIFTADLGAAKVRNETEQWLAQGLGVVAERRSERTNVFGVPLRSADEQWVMERFGDAPPEPEPSEPGRPGAR